LIVGSGGTALIKCRSLTLVLEPQHQETKLDVEGTLRTKVVREAVHTLSIASNVVTIDLSIAQNFLLSATCKCK
jgi:hypothetical protein